MFAVGIMLAIGCGKKDAVDTAIAGLEGWTAKMCACKDKACVEKTHEDYKKWENDVMEPSLKNVDQKSVAKDKMEKFEKVDDARKECRRKYRDEGGAGAGADGAAPTPTAPPGTEPAKP